MKPYMFQTISIFLIIFILNENRAWTKSLQSHSIQVIMASSTLRPNLNIVRPAQNIQIPGYPLADGVEQNNYRTVQSSKDEPCLTISWMNGPDGRGAGYPRLYFVNDRLRAHRSIIPSVIRN